MKEYLGYGVHVCEDADIDGIVLTVETVSKVTEKIYLDSEALKALDNYRERLKERKQKENE